MAQVVPIRRMPGSNITTPARDRRSHHCDQTRAAKSNGPTHPLKPICAGANVHYKNPTGITSGAGKEERTGIKVGPTSHLPVQAIRRTGSRRPSGNMEDIGTSVKRKGSARLRNGMQRERTSSQMQSAASDTRSSIPTIGTPLSHRIPRLCQRHSKHLHVSRPLPLRRLRSFHGDS